MFLNLLLIIQLMGVSTGTLIVPVSTHWMVTESGLIQPKHESPFEMARPYDLLAFLNQDTRWDNIINLYHDLSSRQEVIDKLWNNIEKAADINVHTNEDKHCIGAGLLNLINWYAALLDDGRDRISESEYDLRNPRLGQDTDVPDCKKISSLTFSMYAFDHLEGVSKRDNVTITAEMTLPDQISPIMNVDQFGHWIAHVLPRNTSSWLHYNMASLYWRVRGNAAKALECSRRAVHYAPREHKDIALQSMGSILHRGKRTEDAAIVLGAAVEHDQRQPINHFLLANAFAVNGDFNNSIKHFDKCLKLNGRFDLAQKHKNGVLCHSKLYRIMVDLQETLRKMRYELSEYSSREALWLKSQAAFLKTMYHKEEFDFRNVENNCEKMTKLTGLNVRNIKNKGDKNSAIQYFLDGPINDDKWLGEKGVHAIESMYNLQKLVKHIEENANIATENMGKTEQLRVSDGKIIKEIGPMPTFKALNRVPGASSPGDFKDAKFKSGAAKDKKSSEDNMFEFEGGHVLYPPTFSVNRNIQDYDKDDDWPSRRHCKEIAPQTPKNIEAVHPVFLPIENKGIRLNMLLSEGIGVPLDIEHELPWHPPNCPQDKDAAHYKQKKPSKSHIVTEVATLEQLRHKLLDYVSNGNADVVKNMQEAEIGQRIYTAIQKNLAPKWLLYTISSLYYRVRGNNANALHCLLSAKRSVPTRYKDVVLASLASVYLEMGYFEEALASAEEAYRLGIYEPAVNFIFAELNMIKKNHKTQMYHLKQTVRVEPNFMNGLARNLLDSWACKIKEVIHQQEIGFSEGDICTQVEQGGSSMVCEKDGTNCHITNVLHYCFSSRERDTSALVRMLEQKDEIQQRRTVLNNVDDSIFDQFVDNMPSKRRDKEAHETNYANLMKFLKHTLQEGCGPTYCKWIHTEEMGLKQEDCNFQHLQLSYWLHIISFRQMITDPNLRLPPDIISTPPSNKKVPQCPYFEPTQDFYLNKLRRVDTSNWEPVLSLMHQFSEMFDYFDFHMLGGKIAKYIENRSASWAVYLGAGWWCGADGRGECALRCLQAAHALAPPQYQSRALQALATLLHMQAKHQNAKEVAYLSFYAAPKNKAQAFLVGVSHTYMGEYEMAVWMYRYSLTFDDKFLPAKACLHATMCLILFGDRGKADISSSKILKNKIKPRKNHESF